MNNDFDNGHKGFVQDAPEMEIKRRYTPEEAGHDKHRKPVTRVHRNRKKKFNPGFFLIGLVLCAVIGVSLFLIISEAENREKPGTDDGFLSGIESAVPADDGLDYYTIEVASDDVHKGSLILVNANTEYMFPQEMETDIVSIVDHKNDYYLAKQKDAKLGKDIIDVFNTLCSDFYAYNGFTYMQVNSAYRSKQDQIDTYEMYRKERGEEYAKNYVATPGFSEHHTGLALDLNINRNGVISYVESDDQVAWFRENAKNYGFILRYPKDKVYLTGINYESWHYRYVGVPHAQIMSELNMCLEEYVIYINSYTYEGERVTYNENTGVAYDKYVEGDAPDSQLLIYSVPVSTEEKTEIQIPKGYEYTVSGNNVDGFIVTAAKE